MRTRLWQLHLGVGVLAAIGGQLLLDGGAQAVAYELTASLSFVGLIAGVVLQRPRVVLPWLLFAAGEALFVAGDSVWEVQKYVLDREPAVPSIIDALWLPAYPLFAVGLVMLVRRRAQGHD